MARGLGFGGLSPAFLTFPHGKMLPSAWNEGEVRDRRKGGRAGGRRLGARCVPRLCWMDCTEAPRPTPLRRADVRARPPRTSPPSQASSGMRPRLFGG